MDPLSEIEAIERELEALNGEEQEWELFMSKEYSDHTPDPTPAPKTKTDPEVMALLKFMTENVSYLTQEVYTIRESQVRNECQLLDLSEEVKFLKQEATDQREQFLQLKAHVDILQSNDKATIFKITEIENFLDPLPEFLPPLNEKEKEEPQTENETGESMSPAPDPDGTFDRDAFVKKLLNRTQQKGKIKGP